MPLLLLLVTPLRFLLRKVLKPIVTKFVWRALKPILAPIWNKTGGPYWAKFIASLPEVERVTVQSAVFIGICNACHAVADHRVEKAQPVVKTPRFLPNIGAGSARRTSICPACDHRRPVVEAAPREKPTYRTADTATPATLTQDA